MKKNISHTYLLIFWCGIKYQIRGFRVLDMTTGRNLDLGFTTS